MSKDALSSGYASRIPALPNLVALTREQLIDCVHRLHTGLLLMATHLDTNEMRIRQLERLVSQSSSQAGGTDGG